jgi:flagellar biosynthetic protein FlhB
MIMLFAAPMASSLQATFRTLMARSYEIHTDGPALVALAKTIAIDVISAFGIPLVLLTVAAFAGNFIQHRVVFSAEPIKPQLSRISPVAGAARLFSRQALANFAKGLVKLCLIGTVIGALLWPQRDLLRGLIATDPVTICRSPSRSRCGCSAPWSRFSRSSPPPIIYFSTGNGSSGRKCHCGK